MTSLLPHNCELANIDDSANVDSAQHIGRLRCFPISQNIEELGKCHINLWETSGIDESNFNFELLSEILKGNIPDGFEMIETIQGKNIPCSPSHNDVNRRIHAVLLFVPVNICEDIPMLKRLSNILVGIYDMGICLDFIITRADTINNPRYHKTQISNLLNFRENRISLVVNYSPHSTQKNFQQDIVALEIFYKAVNYAEFCIRSSTNYDKNSPLAPDIMGNFPLAPDIINGQFVWKRIIIAQNAEAIGSILVKFNHQLVEFRERIISEIPSAKPDFQFIDEYTVPVSVPQEIFYTVTTILTNGTINIR